MRSAETPSISIVVPVYNEEECLPTLIERITTVLAEVTGDYEMIFVDGSSSDGSYRVLEEAAMSQPTVRCVSLSRNSGHQAALTCGLELAKGDVVITMDADLQHPPELIPVMLGLWRQGYDVVNTAKQGSDEIGIWKRLSAWCFYRVYNSLSDVPVTPHGSDFRLLDRRCVDALKQMDEYFKFHRALVHYIGFRQTTLEFHCPARFAGQAKFSFRKLLALAADGIFSFSTLPLKIPFYLGLLVLAILFLLFLIAFALVQTGQLDLPPGWGYLFCVMVLSFAVQLIFIGIMGLYIARIFLEVKRRPHHFVQRSVGFPPVPVSRDQRMVDRAQG
ncbi:MAG TPA: glycosyltransferase family 2 protein [Thermoanaerobaculia bacterium]|jgi:dolichol-phosphate mannosyltransferase